MHVAHVQIHIYGVHMNTLTEAVAEVVRSQMAAQNKTVIGLASTTGIPYTSLHRKVHGKRDFTTSELAALALELGTTLAEIASAATELSAA